MTPRHPRFSAIAATDEPFVLELIDALDLPARRDSKPHVVITSSTYRTGFEEPSPEGFAVMPDQTWVMCADNPTHAIERIWNRAWSGTAVAVVLSVDVLHKLLRTAENSDIEDVGGIIEYEPGSFGEVAFAVDQLRD